MVILAYALWATVWAILVTVFTFLTSRLTDERGVSGIVSYPGQAPMVLPTGILGILIDCSLLMFILLRLHEMGIRGANLKARMLCLFAPLLGYVHQLGLFSMT